MSNEHINKLENLQFYLTVPNPCGYLDDRLSVNLIADPSAEMDAEQYSHLAQMGFRRSGEHVYKPFCNGCHLCIPLRIPVDEFKADRGQRRTLKKNAHLTMTVEPALYRDEHYELYRRYMAHRHQGGSMDVDDIGAYEKLISASWSDSELMVFRQDHQLLAVSVIDHLLDGISAVYTFFAPERPQLSLGAFAILSQVEYVKDQGLDFVYLGYWNPQSAKMTYKSAYRPNQCFNGLQWLPCSEISVI